MKSDKLDGKKIIFIGNSFVYYGGCVDIRGERPCTDDRGYFRLLCEENGENVSVTDATYGGRHLYDFATADPGEGTYPTDGRGDLLGGLDLGSYDIVVIAEAGNWFDESCPTGSTALNFRKIKQRFLDAGCAGSFYYCIHTYPYTRGDKYYEKAVAQGRYICTMCDGMINWGAPVWEAVCAGNSPGGTLRFDRNSFIIKKSAVDGFHPNFLTGYLTALAVRRVITGESAVGQPYGFCSRSRDFADYVSQYYGFEGSVTNFPEIFGSETDMRWLQSLVDKYN